MTERRQAAEPEDLSALERRGELAPERQSELFRALDASATLRIGHQLGVDFDAVRRVQAGDEAIIERASAGALARPPSGRRFGRFAALVAATFVAASAAAATAVWVRSAPPAAVTSSGPGPLPPSAVHTRRGAARAPSGERPAPATPDGTPDVAAAPEQESPARSRLLAEPGADRRNEPAGARAEDGALEPAAPRAPVAVAPASSAASLFRDANEARRAGDLASAARLYSELQAAFAASREARVSLVSLGKLLLGSGRASEAERQFSRYLAGGRGDLTEEALVGRAESLARLGHSGEEQRVWQELLQGHPSSVYAARARERLGLGSATERGALAPP